MGELVVSCEAGIQLELERTERSGESKRPNATEDGGGVPAEAAGGVRWERFLPKMAVRVLLVEADDSTRQIIAALLRKCSYRVAAVSDGLKAWEVLKGSPCNIDLILTEVELPSISGYALLTLIMEHEVCKNIPVIMMSSQDSVSTVYKCMLKGATDFLVKPVRKNELRNLWQHVWRKQASSTAAGLGPPDESVQQMIEITSENNSATSNHSSGHMSCIQKNKQCTEKGSDAQSSCTKAVESGTEGEIIEHGYCFSQPKSNKCLSDDVNIYGQEEYHGESMNQLANDNENRDAVDTCIFENSPREAIDLIGNFDNNNKGNFGIYDSNVSSNKFDILPFLDLSLRRAYTSGSLNEVNDENPGLNHSDASAFSRYINKPMQLSKPTSPDTFNNQQKNKETSSEKQSSNYAPDNNLVATFQTGHSEITFPSSQNTEISHPIPVRGVRFEENKTNAYNSVMIPSIIHAQSGSSSLSSPPTPHHTESLPQLSHFNPSDHQKNCNSIRQKDNRLENMEDPSGNSNFCITSKGHEESLHVQEGVSQRAMQREAALNKFRMKRKDRCFDKKVRYESRKKLAEQRPRVKGQFVRQAPNDNQSGNATAAN